MQKKDSWDESNLIKTLAALNEIETSINRLGMGNDLTVTLRLIVQNAVRVVTAGADDNQAQPNASAVIWVYDQAHQGSDFDLRVAAGEPPGASPDDAPRPEGLGGRAIRRRRRVLSYEERDLSIHPAKRQAGAQSLVCYPLLVGDEVMGLLYVYRCDKRCFNETELLILDNFVNLATMAIYHGRQVGGMARALERKVKELEKLRWASQLISSRTNLPETFQEILNIGLDITAAQYGSFRLYDKEKDLLLIAALAGRKEGLADVSPLPVNERSVMGWVATKKQSLLIPDLQDSPWKAIYHPLPADRQMHAELAVPLIGAGEALEGVLNIESPRPNAFTEDDQHLLEALATQVVVALQEMRLLDAMQEIAEVLLTANEEELLKLILDRACDLINTSVGSIWTTSDPRTLVLHQSTQGERRAKRLPLNDSFTGQAIRLHRPITVDDVRVHPDFKHQELAVEQGWVSAIVVPMLMPGEPEHALGSFSLYTSQRRDFSDWDKKLLTCLANHAAIAIQNAKGVAQLKQAYNLSEREREVLTLLIQGQTNKEIADTLIVSVNTVKKHVQSIFAKLEVDSRAAAVAKALGQE
ncbi:MAG: GAF domain-containing protein [Anaerolineae bacterium]|nr:GAF domain-containing protein [Anaerolineae bacterium]